MSQFNVGDKVRRISQEGHGSERVSNYLPFGAVGVVSEITQNYVENLVYISGFIGGLYEARFELVTEESPVQSAPTDTTITDYALKDAVTGEVLTLGYSTRDEARNVAREIAAGLGNEWVKNGKVGRPSRRYGVVRRTVTTTYVVIK